MSEDEEKLEELAWQAYSNSLENSKFPDSITINKKDDGTFTFVFTLSDQYTGSASIEFNPSTQIVKDFLKRFSSDCLPFAELLAEYFLKNFFAEMGETFSNIKELPLYLIELFMYKNEVKFKINDPKFDTPDKLKNRLQELLNKRNDRTKKRLLFEIQQVTEPFQPSVHLLGHYYETLLLDWEKAKDCYKKNKKFKNWEKMIGVSFEFLPTELIERLGDLDTYTAMPSSIALEHAARICGIKPNSLGLRALQKHLKQSRKWIKEKEEALVKDEAKNHFLQAFKETSTAYYLAHNSDENDFSLNHLSLLHKLIADKYGDIMKKDIAERAKNPDEPPREDLFL